MTSKDILKRALKSYDGTLILVSHDRDFLQGLTEKVYEFKNRNIKEYIGDINAFLQERDLSGFKELERKEKKSTKKQKQKEQLSYQQKKDEAREKRKLQNRISKLEKQIEKLEKELKKLDEQLADAGQFQELSKEKGFFEKYKQNQQELKQMIHDWENVIEQFERLKI
jgi:ATP-binding cassette subfamily F protein 3